MSRSSIVKRVAVTLTTLLWSGRAALAQVQIPTVTGGVNTAGGNLFSIVEQITKSGLNIGLALIGVVAFIIVAYSIISKFNDCRKDRAEWGEGFTTAAFGVGALILVGFLLTQASSIIGGLASGAARAGAGGPGPLGI